LTTFLPTLSSSAYGFTVACIFLKKEKMMLQNLNCQHFANSMVLITVWIHRPSLDQMLILITAYLVYRLIGVKMDETGQWYLPYYQYRISLGEGIENTRVGYRSYQITNHGRFFLSHICHSIPAFCLDYRNFTFVNKLRKIGVSLWRHNQHGIVQGAKWRFDVVCAVEIL
jgi:hypothetical protein